MLDPDYIGNQVNFKEVEAHAHRVMDLRECAAAQERALQLGTWNALDRSKQYPLLNEKQIVEAVNKAWTKIHGLKKEKDEAIARLESRILLTRIINLILIGLTALATHYIR